MLDDLPGIKLNYRPGKDAVRPDALSRLEQDTPKDANDTRLLHRHMQLIPNNWIEPKFQVPINNIRTSIVNYNAPFEDIELVRLWEIGVQVDGQFRDITKALKEDKRCLPPSVRSKFSISECLIDQNDHIRWSIDF